MKSISISKRAKNTPESAIRKLVPLADRAKKRGIKIYHLNIGQPDMPTPQKILKNITGFKNKVLDYAPSTGIEKVMLAWQKFYRDKKMRFSASDIIVTSGGSEGLIFAFFAVADQGDELLVFEPFYTSYAIIAAMGGVKLKAIRTKVEEGFHMPSGKTIEKAIGKKTKGIVICNPNNPTGTLYTPEEVKKIVDIAKKHNLFIISDETYQEIVFDGKKVLPFYSFPHIHDRLIIVDSVSKRFNSCGARVGCVVSKNAEIISSILRFAQGRLSVATVDQLAVVPMLENHKAYVKKVCREYEKRRSTVMRELQKIPGVEVIAPKGAFYVIPKLPILDSDKFAAFLLTSFNDKKETVMVAPATGFYGTKNLGKKEIRIAYVLNTTKLKRAIQLLGLAIKKYNSNK